MFCEVLIANEGIVRGAVGIREHIAAAGIPLDAPTDCHLFPVFHLDFGLGLGFRRLSRKTGRTHCRDTECSADELHEILLLLKVHAMSVPVHPCGSRFCSSVIDFG
jgi:hypothetical protein